MTANSFCSARFWTGSGRRNRRLIGRGYSLTFGSSEGTTGSTRRPSSGIPFRGGNSTTRGRRRSTGLRSFSSSTRGAFSRTYCSSLYGCGARATSASPKSSYANGTCSNYYLRLIGGGERGRRPCYRNPSRRRRRRTSRIRRGTRTLGRFRGGTGRHRATSSFRYQLQYD